MFIFINMIRSITYDEVLREAFLEKFVEQKQLQLEAPKSDIPPAGMYKLPNQPKGSYYAVFGNNWYYFFPERLTYAAGGDVDEQLSHKKVTDAAEIKKLNRRAKWFRKFSASELQILAKITPKDNTLTYIDTEDGVETARKVLVTPEVVISRMDPKKAAQRIYDAKGIVRDNESEALAVISNITNSQEYWRINKAFMDKVDPKKRTIVEYLRSFLSTADLCRAAWLLEGTLSKGDYSVLKQLNTYGEIKKVATWVYRNMPNSIKNQLNSKEKRQFDAELPAMEITFPGGVGLQLPAYGNGFGGTGAVNLKADYYAGLAQNLKGWHPDAARMVWNYLHSPELYLNEFKNDLNSVDFRDFMAQVGSVAGQATYWTWEETVQYLRELAYSPEGIVGTVVLDVFPLTRWIPKVVFGILLADDIYKISTGTSNDETVMNMIFDALGVFHTAIISAVGKVFRPLLRGIISIIGRGFKMTAPGVKYLVQFIQRASKSVIATLERIGGGKLLSTIVQTFKEGLTLIKSTIKDIPFLKGAITYLDKALATIELYWIGMIKPFLETLQNVIKTVARWPGQTVEYIMGKLGYGAETLPAKAVKAGVHTIPVAYSIDWALRSYAKWKSEYDLKQLSEKQQRAFLQANSELLQEHVIGVPNVKRLESWKYDETAGELKSFGVWNNYEEQMSDAFGNIIPMEMVLYDTLKIEGESATYIKVMMPLDPNLKTIEEVYIKRSEIDRVNTKPLKDIK